MRMVVAASEDACWHKYEHDTTYPIEAAITTQRYPSTCVFDASEGEPAARLAAEFTSAAVERASQVEPSLHHESGGGLVGRTLDESDTMLACYSSPAEAAREECGTSLAALEHQVWLELDAFLREYASNRGTIVGGLGAPLPKQLLALLPPPPPLVR